MVCLFALTKCFIVSLVSSAVQVHLICPLIIFNLIYVVGQGVGEWGRYRNLGHMGRKSTEGWKKGLWQGSQGGKN